MQSGKKIWIVYFGRLVLIVVCFIMLVVGLIACIINCNSIISSFEDELSDKILFYGLIIIFSAGILGILLEFAKTIKDFKTAKARQFVEVTGTVIKFAKNHDEMGNQINNHPIIKLLGHDKTIELFINDRIDLNKTYTFIYLEHTKIGAVKEEYVE